MAFEDNVIVRFMGDNSQLMTALGQVQGGLRGVNNTGRQTDRTATGLGNVTRQSQGLSRQITVQNRALSNTNTLMKDLTSQTGGFTSSFRRAALSIQTGTTWLDKFSIQADRASMTAWRFTMAGVSMQQLAAVTGTTAAGMALATKKMVDSFSLVDRIKRQFTSIYQSAEMGGQMVDQLVTDAVKIRYSVEEVLDAGRLLALEGFSPKKLIYDMADLAGGVNQEGITIVNATRAFVDATNGQFRRLKETFQITREDAMAFAPDAFQGPNNQISNQAKATDAIIRAIRAKYRGMNEATMQTIGGMLSNVDDAMMKSTAKMGKAIEGTVTGWLRSLMGFFDAMGKFADTGMGKAVAQTVLWGTAIMTAVTGLALLTAGMITLMGIFAAYKVFMDGRKGNLNQIINAELELMKISQELAVIEAQRSMGDLERMRAQLVLLRAVRAEEEARAEVVLLRNAGVGGAKLAGAEGAVRSAADATRVAQAGYDKTVLPMQIVKAQEELSAAKANEASLQQQINALNGQETVADREQLGLAAQKTAELEKQVALLNSQLATVRAGGAAADVVGEATPLASYRKAQIGNVNAQSGLSEASRRVAELAAKADADGLAIGEARAAIRDAENEATLALNTLQQKQIANDNALLALEKAKTAEAQAQERLATLADRERERTLASSRAIRGERSIHGVPGIPRSILVDEDTLRTEMADAQIRLDAAKARVALREQKAADAARRLAETPVGSTGNVLSADKAAMDAAEARVRYEAAVAANRQTSVALAAAELEVEEAQAAASAAQVAYEAEKTALINAHPAIKARYAAIQRQVNVLTAQEAELQAVIADIGMDEAVIERERLTIIQQRLVALREEAALQEDIAASAAAEAATPAGRRAAGREGSTWASRFSSTSFGRGFAPVLDALVGPLAGVFGMVITPIKAVISAIAGAGGFLPALGIAAGALSAVALIAAPIIATIAVLNYSKKVHEQFIASIKESITSLKTWDSLIKRPPGNQASVDQQSSDIDALLKMKRTFGATNVYEQLMKQEGMTFERARGITAKFAEQAALNQGYSPEQAAAVRERTANKSDLQLREDSKLQNWAIDEVMSSMTSNLDAANASVNRQGMLLDRNAKKWLEAQIASGGLTVETKAQYEEMLKMEHPAIAVSQLLAEQFKTAKDSVPELESAADAIAKGAIAGETEAEVFADINANAVLANTQLSEMEAAHAALAQIDKLHAAEREKDLRDKREQVRLLNEQAKLFWIIVGLQKTQDAQGVASAAGMGNTGAIFGADIASAEWAAANGEKDPKKRMERVQAAFKAARGSREDSAKQSLDLFAPGPDASPQEKAAYDRYKAQVERDRMAGVEADYQKAMQFATPEQQKRMQQQLAAEKNVSANTIAGFNKSAADTETNDYVARLEAGKRGAAVGGASDQQLLQYDVQIAKAKMEQAIAAGDVAAQMDIQVGLAEKLKGLQDSALGAEEAKLGYMESLVKQGLLPEDALTAEKQKLAQWYKYMASQSQAGSAQQYQYLQKSLDVMGDDTESKWDKIVGKIIGGPATLLDEAGLSEAAIMRRFSDAANVFGSSGNVTADILSQNRQSMTIQVNWDLGAVDGRINQALPSAMNAFAKDFVQSLRSA